MINNFIIENAISSVNGLFYLKTFNKLTGYYFKLFNVFSLEGTFLYTFSNNDIHIKCITF